MEKFECPLCRVDIKYTEKLSANFNKEIEDKTKNCQNGSSKALTEYQPFYKSVNLDSSTFTHQW